MTNPENLYHKIKLASVLMYLLIPITLINSIILRLMKFGWDISTLDKITFVIYFGVLGLLAYWIRTGSKSSRIVLIIFTILNIGFTVLTVLNLIGGILNFQFRIFLNSINLIVYSINIIQISIFTYVLILLYGKQTNEWYRNNPIC